MRQVNARDFGNDLDQYLELVKDESIVIAKAGKPLAVVMSIEEFQSFERLGEANRTDQAEDPQEGGQR